MSIVPVANILYKNDGMMKSELQEPKECCSSTQMADTEKSSFRTKKNLRLRKKLIVKMTQNDRVYAHNSRETSNKISKVERKDTIQFQ